MRQRPALRARIAVLAFAAGLAAPAHASPWWDRLWRTPDQRGQALLEQGDAAAAARTFEDPRRRAYAALKAGDYAAAAHELAGFDDRDAQYNRGNALARAGDLSGALRAYDAALARDPKDAAARHNRELVAQALAHSPPRPSPSASSASKEASKNAAGGGSASASRGASPDASPGGAPASSPASAGSSPAGAASPPSQGASGASGAAGASAQASAQGAHAPGSGSPAQPGDRAHDSPTAKDDAARAWRDAQAMAGQSSAGTPGEKAGRGGGGGGGAAASAAAASAAAAPDTAAGRGNAQAQAQARPDPARPRSEQQLAEDEWLRAIPDDPGGLLRRKFLIEHLMRQQQP